MEKNYTGRLIFIGIVVFVAILLILPTVNYLSKKLGNYEFASDEQEERMKRKAITLGLDLQGGVDLLIAVDLDKAVRQRMAEHRLYIRKRFRKESLDATIELSEDGKGITITLEDPKDYKIANKILEEYAAIFPDYDPESLSSGKATLTLDIGTVRKYATEALDGSLKVIMKRVDEFGVTQPSVSKQGNKGIRVQLPGEKDPEKVVKNLLRPANLEFRLVHNDNNAFVDQNTGKLREGVEIPVGYVVVKGDLTVTVNQETGEEKIIKDADYVIKEMPEITGAYLRSAGVTYDPTSLSSPIIVNLQFKKEGTRLFKEVTAENVKKRLAIVLEDYVFSAPVISTVIPDGNAVITGNFDSEEAKDLALVLKAGAMPAHLRVMEKRTVEATLGEDSIRSALRATVIGGVIVAVFMIVYYGGAGIIADLCLIVNLLVIGGILAMFRATLTLPGIAGILLTIGMAVDANVLIFERVREERLDGKPLKVAISNGFSRVFATIFDANLTTLITALVLLQFGTGSIQGFAFTMTFGIAATLFTGLFVSHAFADFMVAKTGKLSTGAFHILSKTNFDFIGKRGAAYLLSAVLIGFGAFVLVTNGGPNLGVDFAGGVLSTIQFEKPIGTAQVREALLENAITAPRVQKTDRTNEFLIRIKLLGDNPQETEDILVAALKAGIKDNNFKAEKTESVGTEVSSDFRSLAFKAIIIASIGILIYVWSRFELAFGVAALVALFHDIFITVGLLTIFGREISLDVVAALLTIMGYSLNDTIVVFDRIRENLVLERTKPYKEILNTSINQSLSRTVITSLTTLFVVSCMYVFGGAGINDFALTLIIGVIIGTYSSDFIASPVLFEWRLRAKKTKGKARA